MDSSKIIQFPQQSKATTGFDYAAYERRAVRRFRRAGICAWIAALVESVVTAAIGGCILFVTLLFFTIL